MKSSTEKELNGWSQSGVVSGCTFWWRPVTSSVVSSRCLLRLELFNIFINDLDCEIECNLTKFAYHAKMNGAVNTIERRDAIRGGLGRLENWACENIIIFNKVNCKVLNLGWQNSRDVYSLEEDLLESSSAKKDLGTLMNKMLNMISSVLLKPGRL